jgi:UDPglucose 6-dehydrogenase
VVAYDPVAHQTARRLAPDLPLAADPYDLAQGCDALVLVTEWNEFKHLDFGRIKAAMRTPVLVDGRNIYDPEAMREAGFLYRGVGRGYNDAASH